MTDAATDENQDENPTPVVFLSDVALQPIEGLPGVYVEAPAPPAQICSPEQNFEELFVVHDTRPSALCAQCEAPHRVDVKWLGAERLACTQEGQLVRVREERYLCSEDCARVWRETPRVAPREPAETDGVVSAFRAAYYAESRHGGTWTSTKWLGVHVLKCPTDLWVYQEILQETHPDVVIETGTFSGGSALYLATVMDALGRGRVLTIDVEEVSGRPSHPRITYLTGSSVASEIVATVRRGIAPEARVMVVLDSDHSCAHVLAELRTYADLVTPGCYLVVEDTNVAGDGGMLLDGDPGPSGAVKQFLSERDDYLVDGAREKFLLTFQPGGYLVRMPRAVRS